MKKNNSMQNNKVKSFLKMTLLSQLLSAEAVRQPDRETLEEKNERLRRKQDEINRSRGLTLFFYGENKVWALNKKNADKKALKNKWLNP